MKQRAPWPEPQSSSLGLRVLMGQNSRNKVEPGSFSGGDRVSGSGGGAESDGGEAPVCGAGPGGAVLALSGFFSGSFGGFGASRGPRTLRCEFQNSAQDVENRESQTFA